ncbi:formyltransferase family protein [Fibrobacterota bacterium]
MPETEDHSIVLITGNSLRHKRFALRLQQEFGDLVSAWFEIERKPKSEKLVGKINVKTMLYVFMKKTGSYKYYFFIKNCAYLMKRKKSINAFKIIKSVQEIMRNEHELQMYRKEFKQAETRLFAKEVAKLKKAVKKEPIKISNPNSQEFLKQIRNLSPYFFLTLSGPLYKGTLLDAVRGVCINQHAGHSPDIKGTRTIEWALYRRSLEFISSTVHLTSTGADSGPILRRSQPCLLPSDDPGACFARVVALGTEMMIEVVRDIIECKEVIVFEQPLGRGKTYLGKDMKDFIIRRIHNDHQNGWLRKEKERMREF